MHEAILVDVQVASASTAPPSVSLPVGQIRLETSDAGVEVLGDLPRADDLFRDLVEDLALDRPERLEPSRLIVDDTDRGGEAERPGPTVDCAGILRVLDAAADHRVDVDVECGMVG